MALNIRELIRQAFWAARDKGKADWWRMATPVLKNRLLALTERNFDEQDYGARTFADFVAAFPDMLILDMSTYPSEAELKTPKLRSDIWRAALSRDQQYVWDAGRHAIRERTSGDSESIVVPHVSSVLDASWREDFARRQRPALGTDEQQNLLRWVNTGQRRFLPEHLTVAWDRETAWRVWEIYNSWFFANLSAEAQPDLIERPGSRRSRFKKLIETLNRDPAVTKAVVVAELNADEITARIDKGDWLSVGELLIPELVRASDSDKGDELFARVVVAWATPITPVTVRSIAGIVSRITEFDAHQLTLALINTAYRVRRSGKELPPRVSDLAFRLKDSIEELFEIDSQRSPVQSCIAATTKLGARYDELTNAVRTFEKTSATTAKPASIAVLQAAHRLAQFLLPSEKDYLRELDILLGSLFRKFCETCERHEASELFRRASEVKAQVERLTATADEGRSYSYLWLVVVKPLIAHVAILLEEATKENEQFSRPAISLAKGALRVDLSKSGRPNIVTTRLLNDGHGRAQKIDFSFEARDQVVEIDLVSPTRPFDLAGNANQILVFSVIVREEIQAASIPVVWIASDATGRRLEFQDKLELTQQREQPDWEILLQDPPYTINPVRRREQLFGRDAVLRNLTLHANSGTSTFLWGQKRVGKTSVLQVLSAELEQTHRVASVFLRMGELISLHEGQIAHKIAERLIKRLAFAMPVPSEESFGANLSRLVPIAESLAQDTQLRLVVIIDEFDDLDVSLYTGERGRQFFKSLRSLSEVGITFFFLGSERMDAIYKSHEVELNKWVNLSMDRIESAADCRELIIAPLAKSIEYESSAVDFIVEYCAGNPFYMHLFCFEVFKKCVEDHRTYVSGADVQLIRQQLIRSLGRTNFAHFWEDNPELVHATQETQRAENCLVLSCIASLGGRYEGLDELVDVQEALGIALSERVSREAIATVVERLRRRRIIARNTNDDSFEVRLPILREWLSENVDQLLPTWREHVRRDQDSIVQVSAPPLLEPAAIHFPISEDELLSVSQRLVYCGKQKDVAEVRQWLRQFDDDSRIELAFALLKQLAEHGYMTEGARARTLTVLETTLQDRRVNLGSKAWKIVRGRKDNLCITYVDTEVKSGSATARELAKRVRPGKVDDPGAIGTWLKSHVDDDPLLLLVDDFSGTGDTIEKGLARLLDSPIGSSIEALIQQGRVSCYIQFSFPEAVERLRERFRGIEFFAAHVFGDEVRALDDHSGLFASADELKYARDVLLQIGRELVPQNPLGWGDMAVLVAFHNTIPNNSLPIFWSYGKVNGVPWVPLFPRA